MTTAKPYLSVVVTTRNDGHGGDPLYRTQVFLDSLGEQAERFRLPTELIVVEWNPPADRPRLAEVLEWPRGGSFFRVRIIEVSNELHARLQHADRLPLFQMIAKNVGIRRSRGDYVLATNIDIVFDDALVRELARRRLRPGRLYRLDRYDVPGVVDVQMGQLMSWARRNVIRVHMRHGSVDVRTGASFPIGERAWLTQRVVEQIARRPHVLLGLRRMQAALEALPLFQALPPRERLGHDASLGERLAYAVGRANAVTVGGALRLRQAVSTLFFLGREALALAADAFWLTRRFAYWFWCGIKDPRLVPGRVVRRLRRLGRAALSPIRRLGASSGDRHHQRAHATSTLPAIRAGLREAWATRRARLALHTNACGDFTLMAREDWHETRAYPELQQFSMHIDGLFLYQAHWAGVRERVLPFAIFHLEHGAGFRPDAASVRELEQRIERAHIPQIASSQFVAWTRTMREDRRPIPFNDENWGLAGEHLMELDPTAMIEVSA